MPGPDTHPVFLSGPLLEAALLTAVLGHCPQLSAAELSGWGQVVAPFSGAAALRERPGSALAGAVFAATKEDLARLSFYLAIGGAVPQPVMVRALPAEGGQEDLASDGRLIQASGFVAWTGPDAADDTGPAALVEAAAAPGPDIPAADQRLILAAAEDHMSRYGQSPAGEAALFYPQTLQRCASRLRAADRASRRGLRQGQGRVQVLEEMRPYLGFFELTEQELRYPRFDGTLSGRTRRAAFVMADAVTVLPYDPVTDRVMLVEQFRFGAFMRGDPLPWTLEPVAGRIDAGETPEDCARREALEEAGLTIGELIPIGSYYPSAGAVTEYIWSFIGLADLPLSAAGTGGLASEEEDIRAHLVGFDEAMAMLDQNALEIAPLLLSLLHLARLRPGLRRAAGPG